MRKILIILLALGAIVFNWHSRTIEKGAAACTEPIGYTIGSFDRRFNISQANFLSALSEAEAVWEKPFGRELFSYAPETGDLSINLIYDHRQAVTEELNELGSEVAENEADYRALETQYERLKAEHAAEKASYDARASAFAQQSATYEAHVEAWNGGERTSQQEFDALERERLSLVSEASELKALETVLNQKVQEINLLVNRLNRLARTLNLQVEGYNTIGASRGETFAGGIYYSDASGEEIDIYEFENREKLVRILAHELGHALGLEHIADKGAIMYEFNEGEVGAATAADLVALEILCASNN